MVAQRHPTDDKDKSDHRSERRGSIEETIELQHRRQQELLQQMHAKSERLSIALEELARTWDEKHADENKPRKPPQDSQRSR